tara:strand:- start:2602 stop:2796 length:195 start_codon:yes stop_codon:yes gene_type:complete
MKKFLIIIAFIGISTLNSNADEIKDCSNYSKLNPKYLTCKAANIAKGTLKYQKEQFSKKKEKDK